MNLADTLKCDTSVISRFMESGDYDYFSQKLKPELEEAVDRVNKDTGMFDSTFAKVIMILTLVAIIAIIIYMMYKYGWFKRNKKLNDDDEEDEGNPEDELSIEGIEFDSEIRLAEQSGEWNRAVRLIYLNSLKHLSDCGKVIWEKHKTPTEYSIEAGVDEFRWMTNVFLYTRYGEFMADESTCKEMRHKLELLRKGGGDEE